MVEVDLVVEEVVDSAEVEEADLGEEEEVEGADLGGEEVAEEEEGVEEVLEEGVVVDLVEADR